MPIGGTGLIQEDKFRLYRRRRDRLVVGIWCAIVEPDPYKYAKLTWIDAATMIMFAMLNEHMQYWRFAHMRPNRQYNQEPCAIEVYRLSVWRKGGINRTGIVAMKAVLGKICSFNYYKRVSYLPVLFTSSIKFFSQLSSLIPILYLVSLENCSAQRQNKL